MLSSKTVGFFALVGGVVTLVGNFVQPLNQQYYLIPVGAGISTLIGIMALFSRSYL